MQNKNMCRCLCAVLLIMMLVAIIMPTTVYAESPATANFNPDAQSVTVTDQDNEISEDLIIASEEAGTISIELPTDMAFLIDASGSMHDLDNQVHDALSYWFDISKFDFVAAFDTELYPNEPDYRSHHDTDIVGAVEETVELFKQNRIVVATDGVQDPADYSGLTEKQNLDLHLILLGDNRNAQDELIDAFKAKMEKSGNCSLTVYYGTSAYLPVLDNYEPQRLTVKYDDHSDEVMALQNELANLRQELQEASLFADDFFKDMEQMNSFVDEELDEHDRVLYYLDRVYEENSKNIEAVLAASLEESDFLLGAVWVLIFVAVIAVLALLFLLVGVIDHALDMKAFNKRFSKED